MKFTKWLAVGVIATSLLGLAACGSKSDDKNGSASSGVTLKMTVWDNFEAPGMEKIAEAFEKENPNIHVKVEITPWDQYWTKLEAASTGGTAADIIMMHSNESYKYMSNGVLLNLDDLIKNGDVDLDNYYEGTAGLFTYKNSQYGIPKDVSTVALWYNKTFFDEAGISYPDDTWTWETFVDAAKKLTNKDKGIYGYAAVNNLQDGYNNFIFQNEGTILNKAQDKSTFDNPNTIEALQWYVDLINKEKVSPTLAQLAENDPQTMFQSGKVAMITHGSWMPGVFKDNEYTLKNADCAVLPQGKVRAAELNGLGYSIFSKTKYPEEAKKFVAFLASKKGNEIQAETGTAIPAYKGLAEGWVKSYPEFHVQSFVDELDYGVMRPFNATTLKWENLQTETLNDAFSGKITVAEAAKKIQEGTDKIIKENK
ncbi:ABC transporter substrate-binding protein [Lactococcus raffinolactis]|uniref:ABC transporter substrate-binding protein n=1 Tax=Pseudolactococcus raffinolactis TaxID=1366 RepID=UPI0028A003F7|nr:sugar ABC transporter substrate-binding protein [Lactococcus raffinolactis]